MLVYKQSELMSDLLFTVHQHGGDDVTWKPPMHWEMHAVRKLSVWYKIPIWSNSLTLSNASELFWTISKFMKRKWILSIACLRPSQNVKFGIFTSSRAVDSKEMYKKAWCTCKVVVVPCQAVTHLNFSSPLPLNCDPSKTEYSRGKFNCSCW